MPGGQALRGSGGGGSSRVKRPGLTRQEIPRQSSIYSAEFRRLDIPLSQKQRICADLVPKWAIFFKISAFSRIFDCPIRGVQPGGWRKKIRKIPRAGGVAAGELSAFVQSLSKCYEMTPCNYLQSKKYHSISIIGRSLCSF